MRRSRSLRWRTRPEMPASSRRSAAKGCERATRQIHNFHEGDPQDADPLLAECAQGNSSGDLGHQRCAPHGSATCIICSPSPPRHMSMARPLSSATLPSSLLRVPSQAAAARAADPARKKAWGTKARPHASRISRCAWTVRSFLDGRQIEGFGQILQGGETMEC